MHFLGHVALLIAGLVGFAIWPLVRRRHQKFTSTVHGIPCEFTQRRISRSNQVFIAVSIPCDDRFEFTLRRERFTDRLAKAMLLVREFQTSDERFDEAVYIESDEPEIGKWLTQDSKARQQLLDLLVMELPENTRVGSVAASRGVLTLSARCKPRMFASASAGLGSTVATATVQGLKSCLDRLQAFAATEADSAAFRDPYAVAVRTLTSLSLGLLVVPLILYFLLQLQSPPVVLATNPFMDQQSFKTIGIALAGLGILALLFLWGSARLHTVLARLLLLGAIGAAFLASALIDEINAEWDKTTPQRYSAYVLSKYETHSKNSTSYHVWISGWHSQDDHQDLRVNATIYNSLREGSAVTVSEHEGYLGRRWVSDFSHAPSGRDLPSVSDALDRGNLLLDRGQFEEAIVAYNNALTVDPHNVTALADRGLAYIWENDFEDGRKDMFAAAAINPADRTVLHDQGLLALKLREYKSAVQAFTGALAVDPSDGFALQLRAESYLIMRESSKADVDISAAAKLVPNDPNLYWLRAWSAWEERRYAEGLQQADLLVKSKPDNAKAYLLAGNIYAMFNEHTLALQSYDRSIALLPSEAAYQARATQRPATDLAGRRDDFAAAVKLDPRSADDLRTLAQLDSDLGRYAEAISEFSGAIQITGQSPPLLARRGVAYAKTNQPQLARSDINQARTLAQTSSALNDICWTLASADIDLTSALAACRAAVEDAKVSPNVHYLDSLGFVLLRLNRCKEAIAAYNQALAAKPLFPTSLYGRGICERRTGDIQSASQDLRDGALFSSDSVVSDFAHYGVKP
jgi:tetratricopeptide (TPR) repeat protein